MKMKTPEELLAEHDKEAELAEVDVLAKAFYEEVDEQLKAVTPPDMDAKKIRMRANMIAAFFPPTRTVLLAMVNIIAVSARIVGLKMDEIIPMLEAADAVAAASPYVVKAQASYAASNAAAYAAAAESIEVEAAAKSSGAVLVPGPSTKQ